MGDRSWWVDGRCGHCVMMRRHETEHTAHRKVYPVALCTSAAHRYGRVCSGFRHGWRFHSWCFVLYVYRPPEPSASTKFCSLRWNQMIPLITRATAIRIDTANIGDGPLPTPSNAQRNPSTTPTIG